MSFPGWLKAMTRNLLTRSEKKHEVTLEANLGSSGRLVAHKAPQPSAPPQPLQVIASEEIGLNVQERAVVAGSGEAGIEAIRVADSHAPAH